MVGQDATLRSLRQALKPSGRAMLRFVPEGARQSIEDVIEETRRSARWSGYFQNFRRPYVHFTPEQYRALAEGNGFEVVSLAVKDKAWDFQSRAAFTAYCAVTLVEWTRCLPERERPGFIKDVLGRYGRAKRQGAGVHTFEFYQMEIVLATRCTVAPACRGLVDSLLRAA